MNDALLFEIHDSHDRRGVFYGKIAGVVHPLLRWTTEMVESDEKITVIRKL
jgi:hypothetical protein